MSVLSLAVVVLHSMLKGRSYSQKKMCRPFRNEVGSIFIPNSPRGRDVYAVSTVHHAVFFNADLSYNAFMPIASSVLGQAVYGRNLALASPQAQNLALNE